MGHPASGIWLVVLLMLLAACSGGQAAPTATLPPARAPRLTPTIEGMATLGPASILTPAPAATGSAPAGPTAPASANPAASAGAGAVTPTLSPYPDTRRSPDNGSSPCRGGDMAAAAGWRQDAGAISGRLTITNTATAACVLSGPPALQLVDADGLFLETAPAPSPATGAAAGPLTLPPGGTAAAGFTWRNWCADPPGGSISLVVRLPDDFAPLTVPALAPNGLGQRDTPRCDLPGAGSTLAIGAFEIDAGD